LGDGGGETDSAGKGAHGPGKVPPVPCPIPVKVQEEEKCQAALRTAPSAEICSGIHGAVDT